MGNAPHVPEPVGFNLDAATDSRASGEDLLRLLEAARKGCFLEQTLAQSNTVIQRLEPAGYWVDA